MACARVSESQGLAEVLSSYRHSHLRSPETNILSVIWSCTKSEGIMISGYLGLTLWN